jgi:cytochrome o ubiquinol oxidase subunit 3
MAAASHQVAHPTNTGIDNRKLLMWIFLASECLFFGALLSTYLVFKRDRRLRR